MGTYIQKDEYSGKKILKKIYALHFKLIEYVGHEFHGKSTCNCTKLNKKLSEVIF